MMCRNCDCRYCAYNCELAPFYTTPREVDHCCFTCDECKHFDGDPKKPSQWRNDCPKHKEAIRRTEHKEKMARMKLKIVDGGQFGKK